jgi:TPR repeat protein
MIIVGLAAIGLLAQAASTPTGSSVAHEFSGRYACDTGWTQARLKVRGANPRLMDGEFEFLVQSSGVIGKYGVTVQVSPDGTVDIVPKEWIIQPRRFVMVPIRGRLSADGRAIDGEVQGAGCSQFNVSTSGPGLRVAVGSATQSAGDASATSLTQAGFSGRATYDGSARMVATRRPNWRSGQVTLGELTGMPTAQIDGTFRTELVIDQSTVTGTFVFNARTTDMSGRWSGVREGDRCRLLAEGTSNSFDGRCTDQEFAGVLTLGGGDGRNRQVINVTATGRDIANRAVLARREAEARRQAAERAAAERRREQERRGRIIWAALGVPNPATPLWTARPSRPERWGLTEADFQRLSGDQLVAKANVRGRLAQVRAAANAGDADAAVLLALAGGRVAGVNRDPVGARTLLQSAAREGHAWALAELIRREHWSAPTARDTLETRFVMGSAASDAGILWASHGMARSSVEAERKSDAMAHDRIVANEAIGLALTGSWIAQSMNGCGIAHDRGQGGKRRDTAEAVQWFRRASDLGDRFASVNLALVLGLDREFGQDVPAARRYLSLGLSSTDPRMRSHALTTAADFARQGIGEPADPAKARGLYRQAMALDPENTEAPRLLAAMDAPAQRYTDSADYLRRRDLERWYQEDLLDRAMR